MIILQAPHELIQVTTLLPSPEFSDLQNTRGEINIKRSIGGQKYTYVKAKGRRKLTYSFVLTRLKAAELQNFLSLFVASKIRLTNHKNEIWVVNLMNDPFDFVRKAKGEITQVGLEFEGVKISG